VETVKLLKVDFEVPYPILVSTYTNVAVDNLLEGLDHTGVKPLRVGGKVEKEALRKYTLEHQLENHRLAPTLKETKKESEDVKMRMDRLEKKMDECEYDEREKIKVLLATLERWYSALQRKIYAIRQQMLREIVAKADVVRGFDVF
jgi:DNA anti-recombination protein RmuC